MNILNLDATSVLEMLCSGTISAIELVDEVMSHITINDQNINAVVVRDFARARAEADRIDRSRASRPNAQLLGLPSTVKESFDVEGLPTTWGTTLNTESTAKSNAVVVERLRRNGAVILGKTNVPTFLNGLGSWNKVYGRTLNPIDRNTSPGGSSSGSAAAVRAGFSYLDVGSDLSGSIRHPAAMCGVFGHSPSLGLIPGRGHSLFQRLAPFDMSSPGPIARSARDLALALRVLAGPDDGSAPGLTPYLRPARHEALRNFRVLILDRHPLVTTAPEVGAAVQHFAKELGRKGAHVVSGEGVVPSLEEATLNYMRLLGASLSTGQDEQTRKDLTLLDSQISSSRSMRGSFVHGSVFSHAEWIDANEARFRLRWQWSQVFRDFDVVVCPALPVTHLTHEDVEQEEVIVGSQTVAVDDLIAWAAVAKSADLPATVMPFAQSGDGHPIGIQIIGPLMEDVTSIALAALAGEEDLAPSYADIIMPPYQ